MLQMPRPAALSRLTHKTEPLHGAAIAALVSHFLKGQTLRDELGALQGRCLRLALRGEAAGVTLLIDNGRVHSTPQYQPEVTIVAHPRDYLRLARRQVDADTLFFQRRLELVGDTDLGLHLKNLLDAFEYDIPSHLHAVLGPRAARALWRGFARVERHFSRSRIGL